MSDGGGVGGGGSAIAYVILLLMQTPCSGGPQGGPDSDLRGHWPPLPPPPLEPPLRIYLKVL